MNHDDIKLLYRYNRWANARMLGAASALTEDQLVQDLSSSHHSVAGTLAHILGAEWIWLARWKGASPKSLPGYGEYGSFRALKAKWSEVEGDQAQFVNGITDESLRAVVVTYTNVKGEEWTYPLWQQMQHVVNHSSYHRGQVIGMLRQLGAQAPETDLLVFFDEGGT